MWFITQSSALKRLVQAKITDDAMSLPGVSSQLRESNAQVGLMQAEVEDYWTYSEDENMVWINLNMGGGLSYMVLLKMQL